VTEPTPQPAPDPEDARSTSVVRPRSGTEPPTGATGPKVSQGGSWFPLVGAFLLFLVLLVPLLVASLAK
jgi:hypothetical protein